MNCASACEIFLSAKFMGGWLGTTKIHFRGGWLGTAKIHKIFFMNFTPVCENSEMTN